VKFKQSPLPFPLAYTDMKVVLIRPPFYALFGVTTPKMKTYPLNLLYLATYVRKMGDYQAALVDGENVFLPELAPPDSMGQDPEMIMNHRVPEMVRVLEDPDHELWIEIERQVLAQQPDLVGITCNSGNMDTARLLVTRLKRHGLTVILGGSHPSALPEQSILYTSADMAAIGEGEQTLVQVMDALSGKGSLSEVTSLAWKNSRGVVVNPRAPLIESVDDVPVPDRSFINRADYFGEVILTGRGCPFDCAYCASRALWGRKVRLRSVSSIIEELYILREQAESVDCPGRWVVKIIDDTFTVNRNRTMILLDEIVSRRLNCFEFTGGVRADTLDKPLVEKLREANFRRVTIGVESGSPRILKMIRKQETNEDVRRALKLLRDANIHSHAFFMIGLPGETLEDVELSKQLILETLPDHVEINMVVPYPGTDLFAKLVPEDPLKIDRWHRWFHQGMATHSERLGYDLDRAYRDFLAFAADYHASRAG